jgi:DNA-binding HxlR family transcriptional regulator
MVSGDGRYVQRGRDLRHLLNGEWIMPILVALSAGPLHYNELQLAVQELSPFDPWTGVERKIQGRALSRTLGRMVSNSLVDRVEEQAFPRTVTYSLTPATADLLARVQPLIEWADEHQDLIERAQRLQSNGQADQALDSDPDDEDEQPD